MHQPPRRHTLVAAFLLCAVALLGLVPALAQPQPQQATFGYSRMGLPLIARTSSDTIPPASTRSRIVAWLDIPGQVRSNQRLVVVVNVKNEGPNDFGGTTRIIIPYDGRKAEAVDSSFDRGRGDWVRENKFPTDLTVEFGSLRAGESRRGVLYYQLRNVQEGERIRVRGRHSNGQHTCGQSECQMNERQVEVISPSASGGITTLPPGSRVVQKLGDIAYNTRRTWTPEGFRPDEQVVTWLNVANGGQRPLNLRQRADSEGRVRFSIDVNQLANGYYSIVAHGQDTRTEVVGEFRVVGSPVVSSLSIAGPVLIPLPALAAPAAEPTAEAAAVPAQAAGNTTLIGAVAVQGTSGATRLEGVQVNVIAADGSVAGAAATDRYGGYVIGSLASGSYTVVFDPQLSFDETTRRYQSLTKAGVSIPASGALQLNAELALGSTISGQVTGAGAGALEGVSVLLLNGSTVVAATTTADDGRYSLVGAPSGSYTIQFDPLSSADEAVRAYSGTTLASFTVTAPSPLSGKNATLARDVATGVITGQVVAADSGVPLAGVYVVFERLNQATSVYEYAGLALSDDTGAYSGALPPGTYRVSYLPGLSSDASSAAYLGEYFDNVTGAPAGATPVVLAGGGTSVADAALAPGGTIAGTVKGDDKPLADVVVLVYDGGGALADVALTDAEGAYRSSGLAAGSYTLEFATYLSDEPATQAYASTKRAQPVALGAGAHVTGVDATLSKGGAIGGTVSGAANASLAGVLVLALDTRGTPATTDDTLAGLAVTGATGTYTMPGLAAGSYLVAFVTELTGDADVVAYVDEYYNDAATLAEADPVTVSAGATTPNVSAVLTQGGQIRGRVTDAAAGFGLAGVLVEVYAASAPDTLVAFAVTDEGGSYATSALTPGASYLVRFDPRFGGGLGAYAPEYYDNAADAGSANAVSVASTTPVTGIDASLALAP